MPASERREGWTRPFRCSASLLMNIKKTDSNAYSIEVSARELQLIEQAIQLATHVVGVRFDQALVGRPAELGELTNLERGFKPPW